MVDWRGRSSSLFAKVSVGIVVGFLLLQAVSFFYYRHEQLIVEAQAFASSVAERTLALEELARQNPELIGTLESPVFGIALLDHAPESPARVWPHNDEVMDTVHEHLEALGYAHADAVRMWFTGLPGRSQSNRFHFAVPTADGRWLQVRAATNPAMHGRNVGGLLSISFFTLGILLLVLWATRRVTRYFPQFVRAAEQVGRQAQLQPLPVQGPREVRRASEAFNQMQARVSTLLEERTAMLGAFSHDLRTLVTRLALRSESVLSEEQRVKADADMDAITTILDDALAFARDERSDEAVVLLDLGSLLQSLVDDEVDMGNAVEFSGEETVTIRGQPIALRRAFGNLIGNAVRYGETVQVVLATLADRAVVDVVDQGPGIPSEQRTAVLKPYVRLETSRSRETGGSGLGLAIVSNVLRRHGGAIEFLDQEAGFTARVTLPFAAAGPASRSVE